MSDNIHTCHAECPCQTGGKPVSDFVETPSGSDFDKRLLGEITAEEYVRRLVARVEARRAAEGPSKRARGAR